MTHEAYILRAVTIIFEAHDEMPDLVPEDAGISDREKVDAVLDTVIKQIQDLRRRGV